MQEETGVTAIEPSKPIRIADVIGRAWSEPFTTRSDYARAHADVVAMAACDGYITTRVAAGLYDNRWKVTAKGLSHLYHMMGFSDGF